MKLRSYSFPAFSNLFKFIYSAFDIFLFILILIVLSNKYNTREKIYYNNCHFLYNKRNNQYIYLYSLYYLKTKWWNQILKFKSKPKSQPISFILNNNSISISNLYNIDFFFIFFIVDNLKIIIIYIYPKPADKTFQL